MTTYSIVQIGSLKTGWAIEIDGIIRVSYPSPLYLGARLEAMLKGADDGDAARLGWGRFPPWLPARGRGPAIKNG
jgi:hypothetical protein